MFLLKHLNFLNSKYYWFMFFLNSTLSDICKGTKFFQRDYLVMAPVFSQIDSQFPGFKRWMHFLYFHCSGLTLERLVSKLHINFLTKVRVLKLKVEVLGGRCALFPTLPNMTCSAEKGWRKLQKNPNNLLNRHYMYTE